MVRIEIVKDIYIRPTGEVYLFTPRLQLARASEDDHASIGVPPQAASTKPIGLLICGDNSIAYSKHTAEKVLVGASKH